MLQFSAQSRDGRSSSREMRLLLQGEGGLTLAEAVEKLVQVAREDASAQKKGREAGRGRRRGYAGYAG